RYRTPSNTAPDRAQVFNAPAAVLHDPQGGQGPTCGRKCCRWSAETNRLGNIAHRCGVSIGTAAERTARDLNCLTQLPAAGSLVAEQGERINRQHAPGGNA